jgi:hypothetical protein
MTEWESLVERAATVLRPLGLGLFSELTTRNTPGGCIVSVTRYYLAKLSPVEREGS